MPVSILPRRSTSRLTRKRPGTPSPKSSPLSARPEVKWLRSPRISPPPLISHGRTARHSRRTRSGSSPLRRLIRAPSFRRRPRCRLHSLAGASPRELRSCPDISGGAINVSPVNAIPIPQRQAEPNPVAGDSQSLVRNAPEKEETQVRQTPKPDSPVCSKEEAWTSDKNPASTHRCRLRIRFSRAQSKPSRTFYAPPSGGRHHRHQPITRPATNTALMLSSCNRITQSGSAPASTLAASVTPPSSAS